MNRSFSVFKWRWRSGKYFVCGCFVDTSFVDVHEQFNVISFVVNVDFRSSGLVCAFQFSVSGIWVCFCCRLALGFGCVQLDCVVDAMVSFISADMQSAFLALSTGSAVLVRKCLPNVVHFGQRSCTSLLSMLRGTLPPLPLHCSTARRFPVHWARLMTTSSTRIRNR